MPTVPNVVWICLAQCVRVANSYNVRDSVLPVCVWVVWGKGPARTQQQDDSLAFMKYPWNDVAMGNQ